MSELRTNRIVPRDGLVSTTTSAGGIIQVKHTMFINALFNAEEFAKEPNETCTRILLSLLVGVIVTLKPLSTIVDDAVLNLLVKVPCLTCIIPPLLPDGSPSLGTIRLVLSSDIMLIPPLM